MTLPMHMCERMVNKNIAKNPQLMKALDRNKDHPSIKKYSHDHLITSKYTLQMLQMIKIILHLVITQIIII